MSEPMVELKFTSDFLERQVGEALANVRSSLDRGLPCINATVPPHDGTMLIVGTGPSLAGQLDRLREAPGYIMALNEAHDYLVERGITPHGWNFSEVSPWDKNLITKDAPGCRYFVASQCAPQIFDALKDRDVMVWHAWQDIGEGPLIAKALDADAKLIGGGGPFLRALCLGMALGYRKFESFGVDGSYEANSHVAYQEERDDWNGEAHLDVTCYGRTFKTVGYLARLGHDWIDFLKRHGHGFDLKMHGDGLMQHIYRIHQFNQLASARAAAKLAA